jgi:hypothetical protein
MRNTNSSPYLIAAIWNPIWWDKERKIIPEKRVPQSGISFRDKGKNYSRKKSDEDKLFFLSHRRNLESGFEETKGKIISEKEWLR